ncbi:MAG: hypothetical protein M3O09_00725, partial [Acidobacteriota bacterium]|nr:hypothetical protein [Acidobacteriota bacterium]
SLTEEMLWDKTLQRREPTGLVIMAIRNDESLVPRDEVTQQSLDDVLRQARIQRDELEADLLAREDYARELERQRQRFAEEVMKRFAVYCRRRTREDLRRFAGSLDPNENGRTIGDQVATALLPLMSEIFNLLEMPERVAFWKSDVGFLIASEIQQIEDERVLALSDNQTSKISEHGGANPAPPALEDGTNVDRRNEQEKARENSGTAAGGMDVKQMDSAQSQPGSPQEKEQEGSAAGTTALSAVDSSTTESAHLSKPLSKRLQRGKECEEMVVEIMKIKKDVVEDCMTIFQSQEEHPDFRIWGVVKTLSAKDQETFNTPKEWGHVRGYANLLLSKFFGVLPSTIDESRKDWRSHRKQSAKKASGSSGKESNPVFTPV